MRKKNIRLKSGDNIWYFLMATFFRKKSFYSPCSNFVAVVNFAIESFHNLCILGGDKIGMFLSLLDQIQKLRILSPEKIATPRLIISKNIDRDIHLFINFVTIPDYRGGWNYFYLQKVLLRLSSKIKFSQNLKRYEGGSSSTTS